MTSIQVFNTTILCFLYSYVDLKRKYPNCNWPYIKSWQGGVLISIPPALASLAMIFFSIYDDYTLSGIPHINLVSFAFIVGVGLLLHVAFEAWAGRRSRTHAEERISLLSTKVQEHTAASQYESSM